MINPISSLSSIPPKTASNTGYVSSRTKHSNTIYQSIRFAMCSALLYQMGAAEATSRIFNSPSRFEPLNLETQGNSPHVLMNTSKYVGERIRTFSSPPRFEPLSLETQDNSPHVLMNTSKYDDRTPSSPYSPTRCDERQRSFTIEARNASANMPVSVLKGLRHEVEKKIKLIIREKWRKSEEGIVLQYSNGKIDQTSLCKFVNSNNSSPDKTRFPINDRQDLKYALRKIRKTYGWNACVKAKIFSNTPSFCGEQQSGKLNREQASELTLEGMASGESTTTSTSSVSSAVYSTEPISDNYQAQLEPQDQAQTRLPRQAQLQTQWPVQFETMSRLLPVILDLLESKNRALQNRALTQPRYRAEAEFEAILLAERKQQIQALLRALDKLKAHLQARQQPQAQLQNQTQLEPDNGRPGPNWFRDEEGGVWFQTQGPLEAQP